MVRILQLLAFLIVASQLRAAEINATLDRDTVPVGHGARLTLRISGGRADNPTFPHVKDLIIESQGTSQHVQMNNGSVTRSVIHNYVIGSQTPGTYDIPPITVTIGGEKHETEALQLTVLAAAAQQPPAGMANQPDAGPEPETPGDRFGFLTVDLADSEREHVYVGEIAPVRIRAWLPAQSRAHLRSGIQPEGKAFTLHNVSDEPEQTEQIRDGKRYLVVTWYGGISATKPGKHPVSLSVDATVAVRNEAALKQPRRRNSPFDDPFFGGIFNRTPMIEKNLTLKSEDERIEVRPLPEEGRPDGFTGAVGDFKLGRVEIPATWTTGEPATIRARIGGSGNFALVEAPAPAPAGNWKTYPAKEDFTPGDNSSFSGRKDFQFSTVPRKGGPQELSLRFSYFDPSAGEYRTLESPPKPVQVSGDDLTEEESPPAPAPPQPAKPKDQLVAQHTSPTSPHSLTPLVERTEFARLLGLAGLLALAGPVVFRVRKHRNNPERLIRNAALIAAARAGQNAARCAAASDVPGFLANGRLALQHRLSLDWNQSARAITSAEILAREPADSPVARFFLRADHYEYSSEPPAAVPDDWIQLLAEARSSLEPDTRKP